MQRLITSLLSLLLSAVVASAAFAQADAKQAYAQAKTAYEAGKFVEARDLAQTASQTDPKNPEVFLLLGKAQYQLGDVDAAIGSWKKTLALAPEEPYAKSMLTALRGQISDIDTRIKLVRVMLDQRLVSEAMREAANLLTDKRVSEKQRAEILLLQAEAALKINRPNETLAKVQHLRVLYPKQVDQTQASLLEGQAKLAGGGEATLEGIAILRKLAADNPNTPAAASARYALISYELAQGANPARAKALAKWLAECPDHPQVNQALRSLIEAYLKVSLQQAKPTPKDQLSKWDVDALALADELYKQLPRAAEARELTELLLRHLDQHYAGNGAYVAAINGIQPRTEVKLPRQSRRMILDALARYKTAIAAKDMSDRADTGTLPQTAGPGALPKPLTDVVAILDTINREFPDDPAWSKYNSLAAMVAGYSSRVQPPVKTVGFNGPDAWAIDILRPVIHTGVGPEGIVHVQRDPEVIKSALAQADVILKRYEALPNPEARLLVVQASISLTGLLNVSYKYWPAALNEHAKRLAAYSKYQFDEREKKGQRALNGKLTNFQKEWLASLETITSQQVHRADEMLSAVTSNMQPWIAGEHWDLVEEVYTKVAAFMPEAQRRKAELAVVNLWLVRVSNQHAQLIAAGLTVPRQLDELHKKALLRCYQLQAELPADSPEIGKYRQVLDGIVSHYEKLKYYDVAAAAVAVKADRAVEGADEYAQYRLAQLAQKKAQRELTRQLKQYGSADEIALTPEYKTAIGLLTKFIADHPQSQLVSSATSNIIGIGQMFAVRGAHKVAADVYGDLAKFATGIDSLSTAAPGKTAMVEVAEMARADALNAHAQKVLSKAMADRTGDDPPPTKLSKEYAEAIAAYKSFIDSNPESPQVGPTIDKIMRVAQHYASLDAWDVADSVYADLLASELKLRRPERLKFARGLCQLGQAMPAHAREVLAALTSSGVRGGEGPIDIATLAMTGDRHTSPTATQPGPSDESAAQTMGRTYNNAPGSRPAPATENTADIQRDTQLLAMIQQREANRAAQVAQLRSNFAINSNISLSQQGQQAEQQAIQIPGSPSLSKAELDRQKKAIDAAYAIFQGIRAEHADSPTAAQARAEILVMVGHWRSLSQWENAVALAVKFLKDNPKDSDLPKLRLEIARDRLAWAARPLPGKVTKQARLTEVAKRFDAARADLAKIVEDFPNERSYQQQAQWDIANSFLSQARVVAAFSPTLARGQFVRTTRELRLVAEKYPNHPQIATIPQMLWNISTELENRGYYEEAILVWNDLLIKNPTNPLAQQAAMKVAQTYHTQLKRPLRAAEAYQELNFARGGNDQSLQNAIFQIGSSLKSEKRWVESMHILANFVDSFPRHPQAGQALTMVGQIHQANEAWEDAITAYRRVITEFKNGQFVQESKWAIAECTINLSNWNEAMTAYRDYVAAYPSDGKVAEAKRRIEVLKTLARYQILADEDGQRKAFDAQYQIATIVQSQLSNPVKAIIEYRKVVENWPKSHLADDALYLVGTTYLSLGETTKARDALLEMAKEYPASPLADDALYMVGKSYEDEAQQLASNTREKSLAKNKEVAQRNAYDNFQSRGRAQQKMRFDKITSLKQAGKGQAAAAEEANWAGNYGQFNDANVKLFARQADQEVESLTATALADRQDKINAALRQAVESYKSASQVAGADKADDALLKMATIYDERLKDPKAAMATWEEIVRQFSGNSVAEDASWRIAQYHERNAKYSEAIEAYKAFLRSYRSSPKAGDAQFAIAENYEHLGEWVNAMDSYTNYINNFPSGPNVAKAKEQISWIKTYRL